MSGQSSTIAREAKGIHQALKEALKTHEPWDREVDFHRRSLRRQYLCLLLEHPYSKESKDAETYLWMQTSYTFIALYKQHIQALQRIGPAHPQPRSNRDSHRQQQQQHTGHGAVEYRKFLQRFRQFLAEEEKFWAQLVVRFCRSFALDEAQPVLVALGILPSAHDIPMSTDTGSFGTTNQNDTTAAATGSGTAHNANGRGHALFPPEEPTSSVIPETPAQRASRFAILCKALVCLGDIARYRELYNESGGRPKAGQEEGIAVRGKAIRGKRGAGPGHDGVVAMGRARNYDRAQLYYEQARQLVPSEGNASHQLAILASYKKDAFGSLVHYYRALCVRQPYETASENLGTVLSKALEQWRARTKKEKGSGSGSKEGDQGDPVALVPWKRAETMREKVVVLHALWRLGVEKMDAISPKHARDVRDDFYGLVSERCLPPDMISKMVILSQGALWKHRMMREPTTSGSPKDGSDDPLSITTTSQAIEARMLVHVLAIHQVLMEVGLSELSETSPEDAAENDLAQRITAPFRRTLPALRIASKWLRANHQYVRQSRLLEETGTVRGKEGRLSLAIVAEELSVALSQFWTKYAGFLTLLWRTFPPERLPALSTPLEEDVDMRGFLPLRQMMGDVKCTNGDDQKDAGLELPNKTSSGEDLVHPNEEQLMRIADLLNDAKVLAESNESSLEFSRDAFTVRTFSTASASTRRQNGQSSRIPSGNDLFVTHNVKEHDEDTMTETTSRTDDDLVRLAFETALDANAHLDDEDEEDDDNDRIVWDIRAPARPAPITIPSALPSSPSRASPLTPMKPKLSPIGTAARSPTISKGQNLFTSPLTMSSSTTAQDLLNNVMGVPRLPGAGIGLTLGSGTADSYRSHIGDSSAPQPQLLFGSGLPNQSDHSIWSRTPDERTINFTGAGIGSANQGAGNGPSYHLGQQQHVFPSTSSQDFAQSIWSSLYPVSPSSQQGQVPASTSAAQPLGTFPLPLHTSTNKNSTRSGLTAHQRTLSSSSTFVGPISTGHHQKHSSDDPVLYSTLPIGSTRQQQQQHISQHLHQQQQLQPGIRPVGTQSFSSSLTGYSVSNTDTGDDVGRDHHGGGHAHQSKMSHVYAGASLSSGWGNT